MVLTVTKSTTESVGTQYKAPILFSIKLLRRPLRIKPLMLHQEVQVDLRSKLAGSIELSDSREMLLPSSACRYRKGRAAPVPPLPIIV